MVLFRLLNRGLCRGTYCSRGAIGAFPTCTSVGLIRINDYRHMVHYTLFGLDTSLQPQPRVAARQLIEKDGRGVTTALLSYRRPWPIGADMER